MNRLFIVAAICAAFATLSCSTAPKATISGKLENAVDQKIFITERINGEYISTDSATMSGGKFLLETENVYPRQVLITFEKNRNIAVPLIFDASQFVIEGDYNNMSDVKISGSEPMRLKEDLNAAIKPLREKNYAISKEFYSKDTGGLSDEEFAAKQEVLRAEYIEIEEQIKKITEEAIAKNSNNIFGASIISEQRPNDYESVVMLLSKVLPDMPKNRYIDDLNTLKAIYFSLQKGQVAPDFTVSTPDGTPISLSSLRGKVVLLDFWASWCAPCRAANPAVVALYNSYKDSGFTVLGISLDVKKESWLKAIEQDGLTWHHGSDLKEWASAPAQLYAISSIPQTFLIDKDGKILGANLYGEELKSAVESAL